MVFALRTRYPEFPPEHEGEKAQTFTRVLLNTCQEEFESLPTSFEPTEEEKAKIPADDLRIEMKKRKDKMLANMKFIGNLFLRQLLAVKVIGQVVHDLIGIKEKQPEEHMIECVCELLQAIGHTLDATAHGKVLMSQFSARLLTLKHAQERDGKATFSKRIQFQIQDLLDLRHNGWAKKLFKEQAKTKDEVRKDALAEARKQAKGAGTDAMFITQIAGVRPSYIDASKVPGQGQKQRRAGEVVWDQAYVKRICQYYADDRNGEELDENWKRATPTSAQTKQGIEWLLDLGFNDRSKEDIMAETITELLSRRVVSWQHLEDALTPMLEGLEDMRIDVPHCDSFFHALLSRLLLKFQKEFNASILKPLTGEGQSSDFTWRLLLGGFKKAKERGGRKDSVVAMVVENNEFAQAVAKVRKCSTTELRSLLQKEGL
uniref:MIF4G domain-containing protein n=1 Tax=Zooxanthella nutricula TaxID=1333877 RepID=A0A7S2QBJ4_9DINO